MRGPTNAAPIVTGSVPNVLSSRKLTASPGIVTRAMRRTVALLTTTGVVFGCCDVPQAVIQPLSVAATATCVAAVVAMHPAVASAAIAFDKVILIMVAFPRHF